MQAQGRQQNACGENQVLVGGVQDRDGGDARMSGQFSHGQSVRRLQRRNVQLHNFGIVDGPLADGADPR